MATVTLFSDLCVCVCVFAHAQLQEIVGEMRGGFETAMLALTDIQNGDKLLEQTVNANRAEYEKQLADVLQMVLSLKVREAAGRRAADGPQSQGTTNVACVVVHV